MNPDDKKLYNLESYPSLMHRVWSNIIDLILILVMFFTVALIFKTVGPLTGAVKGVLFFAILFLYEPICISVNCTLGHYFTGLRVRSVDGKILGFHKAILRYIVKSFLGWISFFTVVFDEKARALHDFATGPIVVYEEDIKGSQ